MRTSAGCHCFHYYDAKTWNNLPETVQSIEAMGSVRRHLNPLDAGRRSTDFAQTPYAAGSLLTDGTVYERSGW